MYYMMFVQIQNDMNDLESNLMDEINWVNNTVNWAYMDLSNANLYYADLRYADLENADLYYADLTGVYWYDTTCPDGTNSNSNGNTCANNL